MSEQTRSVQYATPAQFVALMGKVDDGLSRNVVVYYDIPRSIATVHLSGYETVMLASTRNPAEARAFRDVGAALRAVHDLQVAYSKSQGGEVRRAYSVRVVMFG